jgi:D-lactate dehydrogenase
MNSTVCFYEAFEEEARALRRELPRGFRARFTPKTIQEAGDTAPPAPLISIRTQSAIPPEWAPRLRGILSRSTGYDHLVAYRAAAGRRPPACGYLPLYCNRAVAEQAMLLWMALLRKLPLQTRQFRTFHRDGITGLECERKVLLVVGVGHIGHEVCRLGSGLGMTVLGVDLVHKFPSVHYVTLEEGLRQADVIVCCMNLTAANAGYFTYRRLRKAQRSALFVNVARGEHAPAADLLRLLEEGRLGGVALDVHNRENELAVMLRSRGRSRSREIQATLALARHPRAILTPHNAFNTAEAVGRKAQHSVQQVLHFLEHGRFLWPVPKE